MGIDSIKPYFNAWTISGAIVGAIALGVILLIIFSPPVLRVPDGIPPDVYYREWKAKRLMQRIGRGPLLIMGVSLGIMLGGCGALFWGIAGIAK